MIKTYQVKAYYKHGTDEHQYIYHAHNTEHAIVQAREHLKQLPEGWEYGYMVKGLDFPNY
jgi:hypothetical protein